MTRVRLSRYRELARVAEATGFHWTRRQGSHGIFRHADGRIAVIPDHGSWPIGRGLLHKILRQLGLTVDEYHRLLDE